MIQLFLLIPVMKMNKRSQKYFDYLDDEGENEDFRNNVKNISAKEIEKKPKERDSRKTEYEKDIKHIERHLSMKKTIRKKMMRDLQQAFVENPGEFQQDPARIPKEKKNIIDIHNLTISKRRLSKSEHSFLDMLKENESKDRKCSQLKNKFNLPQDDIKLTKYQQRKISKNNAMDEDDSGNDSPTREKSRSTRKNAEISKSVNNPPKEEKKLSFWKRLTGKGNKCK